MAPATARSAVAVVLFALFAEGKINDKFWGFLDDMATEGKERSDATTVAEILEHGGTMKVEDCGHKSDVMDVTRTEFERSRLQVRAYGNLSRGVSGGTISVKMYKSSAAEGSSTGDWMKRELAWHSVPHKYEEDLCKHFGKSHSRRGCPLPAGSTQLRFAVDKLPPMVVAGAYKLKIRAVDAFDKQVACVRAHLEIPRGKSGEIFRRVQGVSTGHRGRTLESATGDCSCGFSDPVCGDDGETYDCVRQTHCAKANVAYAGKCVDQSVGRELSSYYCGDNMYCFLDEMCGGYWNDYAGTQYYCYPSYMGTTAAPDACGDFGSCPSSTPDCCTATYDYMGQDYTYQHCCDMSNMGMTTPGPDGDDDDDYTGYDMDDDDYTGYDMDDDDDTCIEYMPGMPSSCPDYTPYCCSYTYYDHNMGQDYTYKYCCDMQDDDDYTGYDMDDDDYTGYDMDDEDDEDWDDMDDMDDMYDTDMAYSPTLTLPILLWALALLQ